jgi:hypothetical protein
MQHLVLKDEYRRVKKGAKVPKEKKKDLKPSIIK